MGISTDYLVARPSFFEGVARLADFGGTLNEYNYSPDGEVADAIAIWMDWAITGQDIREAMDAYTREMERVLS